LALRTAQAIMMMTASEATQLDDALYDIFIIFASGIELSSIITCTDSWNSTLSHWLPSEIHSVTVAQAIH
jgi:hypothetical protein